MSWISDVKTELAVLEISKKKLRNFGLLVGGIFILISVWIIISPRKKFPEAGNFTFAYIFLLVGFFLFLFGSLFPNLLKTTYKIWMGLAFAMGWIMSRLILIILYYLVVTPIGILAKIVRKEFLDLNIKNKKDSYWILRSQDKQIDYTKMF